MAGQRRELTDIDRSIIEVRLRDRWGIRQIARAMGRFPGTISAEISRHGGASTYRAASAAARATSDRRLTGRRPRLAHDGALFGMVAALLRLGWSPEQAAASWWKAPKSPEA